MNVQTNIFPKGLSKCVLMSFDDGNKRDLQIAEIMEQYGIRGTFHINSGCLGKKDYLTSNELLEISKRNEIAAHTVNHINMTNCPLTVALRELVEDRVILEEYTGKIIRGMAFPYGKSNEKICKAIYNLGFEYARKSDISNKLVTEYNFSSWTPTCHINEELLFLAKKLITSDWLKIKGNSGVLFLMGHSCQLQNSKIREIFKESCKIVGNRDDIWYATCIEYVDYINALQRLQYSGAMTRVHNPSDIDVWIMVNECPIKIGAGITIELEEGESK